MTGLRRRHDAFERCRRHTFSVDDEIHDFFKDEPTRQVIIPKEQVETIELGRFMQQASEGQSPQPFSSI